jgi:hypothetical protein
MFKRVFVAVLMITASAAMLRAAVPSFWQVATQADFPKARSKTWRSTATDV